jgi:hypothetical protein
MGKTYNDVVKDENDEHYRMVHVVEERRTQCNVELYQDWQGENAT